MKIIQLIIYLASISFTFGEELSVDKILLSTLHRLDSINHQFSVNIKETGKKEKIKNYQISIQWPEKGDILKRTRVKPIQNKRKKPSSIWEHQFKDRQKTKRWMTMPITGKLKDISDKKSTKKFTLADLEFTEKEIAENEHSLLPSEVIGDHSVHVIKSVKKGKNGKVKKSKKLWIDTNDYLIHKAEFYTKSGRLYRSVECTDVQTIEGISFPLKIFVKDLKSKSEIFVQLDKIEINPQFEAGLFMPEDQ
ncbi:MAG TPA: outer membrane lipoprotein-sorting protein [Candidatus Marinimicrobia bacterium]|nr:outer membrane lipoprotein-sorting protein [Candidatus Neomarinimicrobiota bacterium]